MEGRPRKWNTSQALSRIGTIVNFSTSAEKRSRALRASIKRIYKLIQTMGSAAHKAAGATKSLMCDRIYRTVSSVRCVRGGLAWRHKNMLCQRASSRVEVDPVDRISSDSCRPKPVLCRRPRTLRAYTDIKAACRHVEKCTNVAGNVCARGWWQSGFHSRVAKALDFTPAATSKDACCRTWSPIHHSQEADT